MNTNEEDGFISMGELISNSFPDTPDLGPAVVGKSDLISKSMQASVDAVIDIELNVEGSEMILSFQADELIAYHATQLDLAADIVNVEYRSAGLLTFRAIPEDEYNADQENARWSVYSTAQDLFSEFPTTFIGPLWSLVSAMKLADWLLKLVE